jgi:radical SAM family uncharacterized protein/radical SAM-linked protein
MSEAWERILRRVERPARYTGGEWNAKLKDPDRVDVRVALAFPDVYEVGMSYLGQKILYALLNARSGVRAERVFAPWPDLEDALRSRGLPLRSLESATPLGRFDIVGFSLLYELNASNILTMLDLGGIPLLAADRTLDHPLVIAGGPSAFNPEPLAGVFDLFLEGDGEEAFPEILDRFVELRASEKDRAGLVEGMASIRGVYVPSLYEARSAGMSGLLAVTPRPGAPARVEKRIVRSLDDSFFPADIVVPNIQAVFDRVAVEASRGCPQKCRFCQATTVYHPFRARDPDVVLRIMRESLRATGYEDASLSALSLSDYPGLEALVRKTMAALEPEKIGLSLSSLRPKGLSDDVAEHIVKVRKTGLTLVPEAGTERLRRVINKQLSDEEILEAAGSAFRRGWRLLKLYFMIGLPTEREDDLAGVVDLVRAVLEEGRRALNAPPRINLSVSSFIPKPHTPFQWAAMDGAASLLDKQAYLRDRLRRYKSVEFKDHPVEKSALEAVFSRGDRTVGGLLLEAWKRGARFDGWRDRFQGRAWEDAAAAVGLDRALYLGALDVDDPLPWDHIDTGVSKRFLLAEYRKALAEERTPSCLARDCGECGGCRISAFLDRTRREPKPIERLETFPRLGRPSPKPRRYRLFYAKKGRARYLSQIDLLNVVQRVFRRAGLPVAMTEGFHPKMQVSFLPALPLGMAAERDVMEIRSRSRLEPEEAISALNAVTPEGLAFLEVRAVEDGTPSLSRSVAALVYALDMNVPEVEAALDRACAAAGIGEGPAAGRLRTLVGRRLEDGRPGAAVALEVREDPLKLVLTIPQGAEKTPRPQDVIRELLPLENPVYDMGRLEAVFKI